VKQIKLLSMHIQNFKGCKDRVIEFGQTTRITGDNGVGKSTVFDAYLWLLFDKNSKGVTNFAVRPLTESGETINNIEISVEATISVDNDEYKLRKTQKQKWVKKRGTDTREFQGNVNEFDINGYPKSQKEFKEFISGIVNEEVFPLISNPTAFTSLPWKEQRDILMQFVGDVSDIGIAEAFGEKYLKLIPELKIANTDDILKKYTKAKNIYNKDMVEIPARIDEVSKQLVIADVGALEVEKTAKEVALQKVEDEISGGAGKLEEINKKREEILNLKFHISEIQNEENQKLFDKSKIVRDNLNARDRELSNVKREIGNLSDEIKAIHSKYEAQEREKDRLLLEWRSEKAKTFPEFVPLDPLPERATICPTCGRELAEEVKKKILDDYEASVELHQNKYSEDKAKFEETRAKKLEQIEKDGKEAAASRDKLKANEAELRKKMDELNIQLADTQKKYDIAKAELDKFPTKADISENTEYLATIEKISVLEKEIEEMSAEYTGKTELEAKKAVLKDEIAEIAGKIVAADNSKVKERIAELEAEQKEVGQKIANQEMMIDLVEDFIRTKMNMISEKINGMFSVVSFKLFDNQINGGLKETCTCTVNGVGHSDVNDGHEIVAGLDIINTFSEKFGVRCPIFIDRAGELNEIYIPEMDNQLILLKRVDNQEFKVESEDK
jgi:exonuclease SbcC